MTLMFSLSPCLIPLRPVLLMRNQSPFLVSPRPMLLTPNHMQMSNMPQARDPSDYQKVTFEVQTCQTRVVAVSGVLGESLTCVDLADRHSGRPISGLE